MNTFVYSYITGTTKCFLTNVTSVRLNTSANSFVSSRIAATTKCFLDRCVWFISTVYALVCNQMTGLSKCFITNVTSVWLNTTVDAFV